jgi:hypothetical protein
MRVQYAVTSVRTRALRWTLLFMSSTTKLDATIQLRLPHSLPTGRLSPHTKAIPRQTARTTETAHEEGVVTAAVAVAVEVAMIQATADAVMAIQRLTTPRRQYLPRLRRPNCLK